MAHTLVRRADLDWVKFDAELARDGSVDPVDKALYAALTSFVDRDGGESDPDPDGDDVPTRKVLAACIGRSLATTKQSHGHTALRLSRLDFSSSRDVWLALLLIRIVETTTGATWPTVRHELDWLHLGTFTGPAGLFRQVTALTKPQADLLAKLDIPPPSRS